MRPKLYDGRKFPGWVRDKVYARDRGVCAICKLDTVMLVRWLERVLLEQCAPYVVAGILAEHLRWPRSRVWNHKGDPSEPSIAPPWEADHIQPVVEAGTGACSLDGYRTLCVWCHRKETRRLLDRLRRRASSPT